MLELAPILPLLLVGVLASTRYFADDLKPIIA